MHDPMVVAWDVPAPWPRRRHTMRRDDPTRWALRVQRRSNPENLGERVYPWWRPKGYRLVVAGREYGPATLATIWHAEPDGRDSGEVCKHFRRGPNGQHVPDGRWRWHVWHWKVQLRPLQTLRRRLLTRCSWCGGRDRKRDAVNTSAQWDHEKAPWWRGEVGLYHSTCLSAWQASRACTCDDPLLKRGDHGECLMCGLFRSWRKQPYVIENQREYKALAVGERPSRDLVARARARAEQARERETAGRDD